MPTARPSMVANSGAVDDTGANAATMRIELEATPTPTSAVTSGTPAAITDRKVIAKTTKAIPRPTISVQSTPDAAVAGSPEYATSSPASTAGSMADSMPSSSVSVMAVDATVRSAVM